MATQALPLDQAALDQCRPALHRFLFRRTGDWSLAEDLVQETLLRLVVYARSHVVTDLGALARSIAINLVHDDARRRKRQRTEALHEDLPCPVVGVEEAAMQRERVNAFTRALQEMSPLRREVFVRSRVHGQRYSEIAAALGLSEAAVEKHVGRGLRGLKQSMALTEHQPPPAARVLTPLAPGARRRTRARLSVEADP